MKKLSSILVRIILPVLIVVAGYGIYQFVVVPRHIKLDVPTLAYPRHSVYYRYSAQLNITSTVFGGQNMSISQIDTEVAKDMERIKSSGFDGVKLGYHFQNNNSLADRIARKAAQAGLYPISGLLGGEAKPEDRAFTPSEMADWLDFVRGEVSANKNIIYYWEIWGEPSLDADRYGTPAEFVQLLKATYPVIKKANPNAKVIVTLGAEATEAADFDDQILALGGGEYFDVLSFHPYGANPYLQEDQVREAIAHEQSLLAKYGNHWPLVISEIGQPASEVSETEQARLASFLYAEAAKNNIPVTWFYWSDAHLLKDEKTGDGSNWGLIRFDGTERPMLEAIKPYLEIGKIDR
ncbi:MAG: hypothetical protein PHH01_00710 [Patescibacteria group bacterium]|nr:hypothetical protein [Patescibacteria group bacterium]